MFYLYLDSELISVSTELCEIADIIIHEILNPNAILVEYRIVSDIAFALASFGEWSHTLGDSIVRVYYGER